MNKDEIIKTQQEEIERYKDMKQIANLEIREVLSWKNEIKRLNAEIEKKDRQLEERTNRIKKLEKSCQEYFDALMEMVERKNKASLIITEMAKYISNLDIDEDICKKVDNPCKDYAGENKKTCDNCIKEYFLNKVEKENK